MGASIHLNTNIPLKKKDRRSLHLPTSLTPELAYFIGLLRDGNLHASGRSFKIRIYQKNRNFLEETVNNLTSHLFGKKARILQRKTGFVWQVDSKPLFLFIVRNFGYPVTKTQKFWRTPTIILTSPSEIQRHYIAGFFDAEGSYCLEKDKIVLYLYHSWHTSAACPPLRDIKSMLNNLDISSIGPMLYKRRFNAFKLKIKASNALKFLRKIPLKLKTSPSTRRA